MNVDELHEEMEGSRRDIQQACDSVHILYYHSIQPWMQQQPVQAAFVINIKPPTHPSSPTRTTATSPLLIYAAAAMPHGYQRIHPAAAAVGVVDAAIDESTVFRYDSDVRQYPTLNGVLLTHCRQYRVNKEDELTRKLKLLAAAHGEDDEADDDGEREGSRDDEEAEAEGDGKGDGREDEKEQHT